MAMRECRGGHYGGDCALSWEVDYDYRMMASRLVMRDRMTGRKVQSRFIGDDFARYHQLDMAAAELLRHRNAEDMRRSYEYGMPLTPAQPEPPPKPAPTVDWQKALEEDLKGILLDAGVS